MNKTAWYDNNSLPSDMVNGALGHKGWGRLESSDHFKILNDLIKSVNPKSIADLGCGAAEIGRLYPEIDYTGFDLPHIIEKVAKTVNPNLKYQNFDAYNFDYTVFKQYDLLVCNSFISELTEPINVLKQILENSDHYLIIHRQFFSDKTEFIEYETYANLRTIRSHIGLEDFNNLLIGHEIVTKINSVWGDTVLIKKKS